MNDENQFSKGKELGSEIPLTQSVPKNNNTIWKTISIILITLIVVFIILAWYGNKIIEKEMINEQTTNNEDGDISMEDYLNARSEFSNYRQFAEGIILELAKGNTQYLNDNLSPNLISANSQEALNEIFLPAAKKLFANLDYIGNSVDIQPSTDSYGNSGYSFAMTAIYKDGTEKDFKIYIIKENGKLVVGNIVN